MANLQQAHASAQRTDAVIQKWCLLMAARVCLHRNLSSQFPVVSTSVLGERQDWSLGGVFLVDGATTQLGTVSSGSLLLWFSFPLCANPPHTAPLLCCFPDGAVRGEEDRGELRALSVPSALDWFICSPSSGKGEIEADTDICGLVFLLCYLKDCITLMEICFVWCLDGSWVSGEKILGSSERRRNVSSFILKHCF